MKLELVRIHSLIESEIGYTMGYYMGYIYTYHLHKRNFNYYPFIIINQIGEDLNEGVIDLLSDGDIGINVRMLFPKPFGEMNEEERSVYRLNLIHEGLLKLAAYDHRFSVEILEQMKTEILQANFIVDIPYKVYPNKKNKELVGSIIVNPEEIDYRCFFVKTENGIETQRTLFQTIPAGKFYSTRSRFDGAWLKDGTFFLVDSITGQEFSF